jgi:hypothetical protein
VATKIEFLTFVPGLFPAMLVHTHSMHTDTDFIHEDYLSRAKEVKKIKFSSLDL